LAPSSSVGIDIRANYVLYSQWRNNCHEVFYHVSDAENLSEDVQLKGRSFGVLLNIEAYHEYSKKQEFLTSSKRLL
jgi:hypothetical protein